MKAPNCYFIENGSRCQNPRKPVSNFCEKHGESLKAKSNREIIEQLSVAVRNCVYLAPNKKISAVQDKEAWVAFTNLFNEMIDRGYEYHEVMLSIRGQQEENGIMDDILSGVGRDPKWKKFEKIVNAIHQLRMEGAQVKFDDHIMGKRTGRVRQIDISARFQNGFYSYLIIIECKEYDGKIPIDRLEAFRTKIEDVGAQKGIMVSSAGFQAGAEATAKAYNIDLFTLEEVKTDWTSIIREISISVPFPQSVTFDHMQCDRYQKSDLGGRLSFHDILIFKDQFQPPESLAKICADLSAWLHGKATALPLQMHLKFDETRFLKIPSLPDYIPLYGLKILFVSYNYKRKKGIDLSPQIVSYRYSDTLNKAEHIIPASVVREQMNRSA